MLSRLNTNILKLKSVIKTSRWHYHDGNVWDYDIVVSGGSIVGAAFVANLLKQTNGGLKICILENKPPPALSDCLSRAVPDTRTYALSPSSINFLTQIGAWDLMKHRSQSYTTMQIWESYGPGLVRFHSGEMELKELGAIAEDSTVVAAIYQAMKNHPNASSIEYKFGTSISSFEIENQFSYSVGAVKINLIGSSNDHIKARLLVGADGANSNVRKLANMSTYGWSYGQEAVVATVKVNTEIESDYDGMTAFQRYLPSGPLALLPLWNGYCGVVWSLPVSEAKKILSLSKQDFINALNHAFQSPGAEYNSTEQTQNSAFSSFPFNPVEQISKRVKETFRTIASTGLIIDPKRSPPIISELNAPLLSFPLQFQQASKYFAPRLALIGDAAHSIHPQAGQGLNLGLADAKALSTSIINGLSAGVDYGSEAILKSYHDQRYAANLTMMSSVDIINTMFSEKYKSIDPSTAREGGKSYTRALRSFGMIGIHSIPQIKHKIARFATGLDIQ